MKRRDYFIYIGGLAFFLLGLAAQHVNAQQSSNRIEQVIGFLRQACVTGQTVEINGDGKGNVDIRSFKPGISAQLNYKSSEDNGSVSINDATKRVEADQKIRECMQPHINKVISAIIG